MLPARARDRARFGGAGRNRTYGLSQGWRVCDLADLIFDLSCRYTGPNENFVLVPGCSSGDLETNGFEERIQAIADLLIETVEGAALFFG